MRKIEERMLAAVLGGRSRNLGNTRVVACADGEMQVWLYNSHIATCSRNGAVLWCSLCGWDTATTRSRLRALGVDVPALRRAEGYLKPRPKKPWHTSKRVDAGEI